MSTERHMETSDLFCRKDFTKQIVYNIVNYNSYCYNQNSQSI